MSTQEIRSPPCEYSLEHVIDLMAMILRRGLSVPEYYRDLTEERIRVIYNGIGPEAWCPALRSLVTWILERYEADALIHDVEYALAPRTYKAFSVANVRFAYNACVNALYDRGLTRKALADVALGLLLALLCQIGGWRGYKTTNCNIF